MKKYELIEHTADIGIKVKGADLKELFKNAALAMFDIIVTKKTKEFTVEQRIKVIQEADSQEELFINWLNELLSLSAIKELIFLDFDIHRLDNGSIEAEAKGESVINYRINTEIKAATYHELKIEPINSGWQAQVIFDV